MRGSRAAQRGGAEERGWVLVFNNATNAADFVAKVAAAREAYEQAPPPPDF